ncbi:Holliday junction resolvase RecU [Ectobacillus sp. JY-23]|uniref:Holliday junction resolvase RecU n=1 Tax=Ectobacillus sp. JY-23 TaxID=2933872 RepID=UPI001FF4D1BE|nr:Holliday junction resolvase RecU [Ectobacillus sp. JY-23]UOY93435.1 Holliday junction resolvase RecU [Ectobacillus sp. JY-23]
MTIRYPNGKIYNNVTHNTPVKNHTYSNRGMSLEEELNETNAYYTEHSIACIHKKPVPIQIVKVDYPQRSAAVIKEAYFKQPSTTDYNGVYKGRYIDFEAKETQNKTSFPLQNIHPHQIQHIKQVLAHNGIAFFIIKFAHHDETYFLKGQDIVRFWTRHEEGGRKSITKQEIELCGHRIKSGFHPRIDYIPILDMLYFS